MRNVWRRSVNQARFKRLWDSWTFWNEQTHTIMTEQQLFSEEEATSVDVPKSSKTQDNYSWHFSSSSKYMTPLFMLPFCAKFRTNIQKMLINYCPKTSATTGNLVSLPFWICQQLLWLKTRLRISEEEKKQQLKFNV